MVRPFVVLSVAAAVLVGAATLVLVAKRLWLGVGVGASSSSRAFVSDIRRSPRFLCVGPFSSRASTRVHGVVGSRDGVRLGRVGAETRRQAGMEKRELRKRPQMHREA